MTVTQNTRRMSPEPKSKRLSLPINGAPIDSDGDWAI
jgi:hypothetical protein